MDQAYDIYTRAQRFRLVAVLFLISTLSYADRNVLSVVIESIKREFHFSDTVTGLLIGGPFAIFFSIFGLPIARLADRGDRKHILTACLIVWSVATTICGMATLVFVLFIARVFVGIGEAGTAPTTHSLVADYCAPAQRSRAYSALAASSAIGGFLALTGGGYVAGHFGWRTAFLTMAGLSLPALLLAVLVLKEPRRRPEASIVVWPEQEPLSIGLRTLIAKRSYVILLIGMIVYAFVAYGPILLAPTYLVRVLKMDVSRAGLIFGPALGLGTLIGSAIGGWLGDRLVQRDVLWLVRLPALGLVVAWLPGFAAFNTDSPRSFLIAATAFVTALTACLPVVFTAVQAVCGSQRRALAAALLFGALNMIGMTIGPLLTGWLSDLFSATQGAVGLRTAILWVLSLLLPAGAIVLAAGLWLTRDIEA